MKTSTFAIAAGVVGVLYMLSKNKPGLGDDMLLPPPGRTITADGQVLGGLGLLTTYQDVYDAAPSQYNRTPRNDFMPGLGKVSTPRTAFVGGRSRPGAGGASLFTRQLAEQQKRKDEEAARLKKEQADKEEKLRMEALAQQKVNETLMAIQKRAEEEMAAQQTATLPPVDTTMYIKRPSTPYIAPPRPTNTYDATKAAFERASMSQASDDSGYGSTSDDSGYGAAQQVTEEGAPNLPERITSVQTPSAVMQDEAPATASGDTKVGLLVGGGVLAAIAAALAF